MHSPKKHRDYLVVSTVDQLIDSQLLAWGSYNPPTKLTSHCRPQRTLHPEDNVVHTVSVLVNALSDTTTWCPQLCSLGGRVTGDWGRHVGS